MAAPRWPARLALALLFVGACSDVARAQLFDGENTGFYNPCQAPTPVLRVRNTPALVGPLPPQ